MKAIQLQSLGSPAEAVRLVDVPDVGDPGPDEIVIEVEAAPVTGSDFMMMAGIYGYKPALPHIMGMEGVGRVAAVGKDVTFVKEGDRTLVPLLQNAWAERVKTNATWLRPLPEADVLQLAMLGINPPTAYLLLTEIVPLKRGDWMIQNGANSSVGRALIAIAKSMGIRTVNVVRRPELVEELQSIGGDVVLVDGPDLPSLVAKATGNARISLAVDMVSDAATLNLMGTLAPGGTVVFYSMASRKPLQGTVTKLIFEDMSIRGFWLVSWFKRAAPEAVVRMYDYLAPMVASGAISAPVAGTYVLDQISEALAIAAKREGKILLLPNGG